MFGHDDSKDDKDTNSATVNPTFDLGSSAPTQSTNTTSNDDTLATPEVSTAASEPSTFDPTSTLDASRDAPQQDSSTDETPLVGTSDKQNSTFDASSLSDTEDTAPQEDTAPVRDTPTIGNQELFDLKKKSLEELSPLLGHLDQSAEEKYKTTMMMIQATDDSSLIQTAHDAALQISDEKIRAQALLDIVNEINYFIQLTNDDTADK